MNYIVGVMLFVAGMALGMIILKRIHASKITEGILKVRHDEGEAYLFLELTPENLNNIHKKDYVVLKVDITHE